MSDQGVNGRLQATASASGETEAECGNGLLGQAPASPAAPSLRRASAKKIYISTPLIGLVEGLLFGEATVGEALQCGNFGLGTLNGLDGEVVILDGQAFQQGAEGDSMTVSPSALTPFICTTNFEKHQAIKVELPMELDWAGLHLALQEHFPSANLFYAILVEGAFGRIKARSMRKQTKCRPLAAVAKEQMLFELERQEGSLVGFWSPSYMGTALTVPGFHLHFLSADKQRGGHVLDAQLVAGTAYIQPVHRTETDLPKSLDFLKADLTMDPTADVEAAEK